MAQTEKTMITNDDIIKTAQLMRADRSSSSSSGPLLRSLRETGASSSGRAGRRSVPPKRVRSSGWCAFTPGQHAHRDPARPSEIPFHRAGRLACCYSLGRCEAGATNMQRKDKRHAATSVCIRSRTRPVKPDFTGASVPVPARVDLWSSYIGETEFSGACVVI